MSSEVFAAEERAGDVEVVEIEPAHAVGGAARARQNRRLA